MRKILFVSGLVFCGSWVSQASAASICDAVVGNAVANCGFETGDFTGWTLGKVTDNPGGFYYGVDGFDANSGNYGAYMSQDFLDDGTGVVDLSETLALTPGTYTVSYYLEQDTTPTPGYTHSFASTFGATVMQTLTPTVGTPGVVGAFTEYSFQETATGPSTVLQFSFENDDSFWSIDDISVTAAAPEPSTNILVGLALGASVLLWSRRRGSAGGRTFRA
jgi:hypothetical protein